MTLEMTVNRPHQWHSAVQRALPRMHQVQYLATSEGCDRTEVLFLVTSATREAREYAVRLAYGPHNTVGITCNCEAGIAGNAPCWHMAAAVLQSGVLLPEETIVNAEENPVPDCEKSEGSERRPGALHPLTMSCLSAGGRRS